MSPSRRQFLTASAGLAVAAGGSTHVAGSGRASSLVAPRANACILIHLTGGPSQLDTFDPKPTAPSAIRGPFRAIRTAVPGLHLSELFPRLAAIADRFAVIRTLYHDTAPLHEHGLQWLNTGICFAAASPVPSLGDYAAARTLNGDRQSGRLLPADSRAGGSPSAGLEASHSHYWLLPGEQPNLGLNLDGGFGQPLTPLPTVADSGGNRFRRACRAAVDALSRDEATFITINQFATVFDSPSWDCHADAGALGCRLDDYRATVAPECDAGVSELILALEDRGLLDTTLVVVVGEMGRTPRLNRNGGRDHWTNCWSGLVAGGGVRGGQVIGRSDAHAAEPLDRPVHCAELAATIAAALGLCVPHLTAAPVSELW